MANDKYREDIHRALEKDNEDELRIGQVWKFSQEGLDAAKVAEALNVATSGFVYSYRSYIEAIEDGTLPVAPTRARQCGAALRSFAKRHKKLLSPDTILRLQELADKCVEFSTNPEKQEEEEQKLKDLTSTAEASGVRGIYVYTLPHYLRYPVDPSEDEDESTDDRTYLKVGMSGKDIIQRVRQQVNTALPEEPILLRIYVGPDDIDNIKEVETKIHNHLTAADHRRNRQRGAGTEWFLTHLKFLDSTADLLNLTIHFEIIDSAAD